MPTKFDEEIIDLTEVVEDDQKPGDVDDFLSAFDEHGLFKQPVPFAPSGQDELADEDLESFFPKEAKPPEVERPFGRATEQISEKMLNTVPQEPAFDEEFQSVLKDLTNEFQENQQRRITRERAKEVFDFEKQWKAALGGEEVGGEAQGINERKDRTQADRDEIPDLGVSRRKPSAVGPTIPLEQALSTQIDRRIGDLLTPELMERVLEKIFRQVLEPLAERILIEVAEKILTQEIERIKADLRVVERKA